VSPLPPLPEWISFFFFQAEDGIRDFHVTGVQTCALPICGTVKARSRRTVRGPRTTVRPCARTAGVPSAWPSSPGSATGRAGPEEIGRAARRERVGTALLAP